MNKYIQLIIKLLIILTIFICYLIAGNAAFLYGKLYDDELEEVSNVLVRIDTVPEQMYVAKVPSYRFNIPQGNYTLEAFYYGYDRVLYKKVDVVIGDEREYILDIVLDQRINNLKELSLIIQTFGLDENTYLKDFKTRFNTPKRSYYKHITEYINKISINKIDRVILVIALVIIVIILLLFSIKIIRRNKKKKGKLNKDVKLKEEEIKQQEKPTVNLKNIKIEPPNLDIVYDKQLETNEEENKENKKTIDLDEIYKLLSLDEDLKQVVNFIYKMDKRTTQKDIRKQFPFSEAKISLMLTELEHKGLIEKFKKGKTNIIKLKLDLDLAKLKKENGNK